MSQLNTENKIEAILFYKNEPIKIEDLSKILGVDNRETLDAIKNLEESLKSRGIALIKTETEVSLATTPEARDIIESIKKEETEREIGKAGLETLSIILYNNGAGRREIDYIRGVNSYFVLRNLTMRGLIEKTVENKILRYKPTIKLLSHLGISKVEDLPEFKEFQSAIEKIEEEKDE